MRDWEKVGEEGLAVHTAECELLALKPSFINQLQTHPLQETAFLAYLIFLGNIAPPGKTTVENTPTLDVNDLETNLSSFYALTLSFNKKKKKFGVHGFLCFLQSIFSSQNN